MIPARPHDRHGFSLMEVLVACGILMLALASIAAVLPAAATRLGEAAAYDRAAATMEMAFSEIGSRGLVSRDIFPSGTSRAAVVIGETLSLVVSNTVFATGTGSGSVPLLTASGTTLLSRIGNDTLSGDRRGYFLEDELQYLPPSAGTLPANSFTGATIGTTGTGPRQFNRAASWAAMLRPSPWGVQSGSATALNVSVAVFRKPATVISGTTGYPVVAMTLTGTTGASGVFQLSGSNTPASLQRRFLRPCGYVLGIPPPAVTGSVSPRWLAIRSSWIAEGMPFTTASTATTCVVFEQPSFVQPILLSGTAITVVGFENLLDVQERTLPVD